MTHPKVSLFPCTRVPANPRGALVKEGLTFGCVPNFGVRS